MSNNLSHLADDPGDSLQDKIIQFMDDREQQGIETVAQHVAHAFSLRPEDAFSELEELLTAERIVIHTDNTLWVVYDTRVDLQEGVA